LADAVAGLQEVKVLLHKNADRSVVSDLKVSHDRLQEYVKTKADATALDEVSGNLQQLAQFAGQKADLSYVNRTNERVQKLTSICSQQEKQIADLNAARELTDGYRLPQLLNRTRDIALKNSTAIKTLQETVAVKAEKSATDELLLGLKEVECQLHCKASQQLGVELNTAIKNLNRQLETKAEKVALESPTAEISKLAEQINTKAGQQDVRELAASLQAAEKLLSQKADRSSLEDTRSHFLAFEVNVEQKAERQEVDEMKSALALFRDWTSRQVEQLLAELSKKQPEADAMVAIDSAKDRWLQECERRFCSTDFVHRQVGDVLSVCRRLEELQAEIEKTLGKKVDQTIFDEALKNMAPDFSSSPSVLSRSYPASCASASTVDSLNGRRSGSRSQYAAKALGLSSPRSPSTRSAPKKNMMSP
jgi:hypothetical protein